MSSLFNQVKTLFSDVYGVRATFEWQYTVTRKNGRTRVQVATGISHGITSEDAVTTLVRQCKVFAGEQVSLGGKTYRIWDAGSGRAWTIVDRTPRSRKGDRARAREAQAAALRSS